ncbi:MAG: NAD(P)/FAD-dependent oxidoreductase [Candidatus Bathyarchaeota archaeon]|nr:NAD(P)/FAD-dependent oxidoreductase [Candidatus Bathyarchaeota archaeon]MDI6806073.1 NAD(P)/FAD-dependent oxidoreductase [Candidatus Bathyarchaeia archaeon]
MENLSDVIVVGGGPCGSFTALNLAKLRIKVRVFEEHAHVGFPTHCPGHVTINGLKRLGLYPLPAKIVENTLYGVIFHSPKDCEFSVRFSSPITCVVNRSLFDNYIAEMAKNRGVSYHLNSRVESLIFEDGFVKGVSVNQNGKIEKFFAKIVVDAEGISSKILRQANLPTLNRRMLVNGVHGEVENVKDLEQDCVEVFLGNDYAPGFYAWLIPKGEDKAKVGLATKHGNPKEFLQQFMLKHPIASKKLRKVKILQMTFHPISLGGPISKTYSYGFLAVGDVASQVKPTTGGGLIFGLSCASIAAEVVHEALVRNDFSSEFLSIYQKRYEETFGFDMKFMLKVRKILNAMSDAEIHQAITLCKKLNLNKTLYNVKDIDFQGKSLLYLLRSPRILPVIFYFFFLYLSANP